MAQASGRAWKNHARTSARNSVTLDIYHSSAVREVFANCGTPQGALSDLLAPHPTNGMVYFFAPVK